jgi:predicted nucleic acid-binding protein
VTYLLDTSVLLDHLHRNARATTVIADALRSGRRVAASVLTRVQLREQAGAEQTSGLEALERLVEWIPVDHAIAAIAAELAERHSRDGGPAEVIDYVVAATAQRVDAELLTCEVDRFPMFPALKAPY